MMKSCVLLMLPVICSSLRVIFRPQDVILAPDTKGVMKEFCSQNCLTSFNYKKNPPNLRKNVVVKKTATQSLCSMCTRYCIVRKYVVFKKILENQNQFHKTSSAILHFCVSCLIVFYLGLRSASASHELNNGHSSFVFPPAEQTRGGPERRRPQALQRRLLSPFPNCEQLVVGRLCQLRRLLPQQTTHDEVGQQQQNGVQRGVSGQVQGGTKIQTDFLLQRLRAKTETHCSRLFSHRKLTSCSRVRCVALHICWQRWSTTKTLMTL